jgi:hypothetical protein
MHGPYAKTAREALRCGSGGCEAGGRQGAEQPTLIGPHSTTPDHQLARMVGRGLTPGSPLHAADLRHRSGVRIGCNVTGLRTGNVAEDHNPSEQAANRRPTSCNQTASADTKRHQTPRSKATSQHHSWSSDGRT